MEPISFADRSPSRLDTSMAIPDAEIIWERILDEEPEVGRVIQELRGKRRGRKPYASWHAFVKAHDATPKLYLTRLVGWRARNPKLRSQEAYRLTMQRMWDLVL